MTINEAMIWQKALRERHAELVALRDKNSARERHIYGSNADRDVIKEPLYDPKALDKLITRISREMRVLEQAIKATNAVTEVQKYTQDDSVLGELS